MVGLGDDLHGSIFQLNVGTLDWKEVADEIMEGVRHRGVGFEDL